MAVFYSRGLKKLLNAWPGKKYFGIYRFLPGFFIFGGLLEFSMINWRVGQTNFYNTYKKRQAHEIAVKRLTEVH